MQAKVITLSNNKASFAQSDVLIDSSNHYKNNFIIDKFIASTPDSVIEEFHKRKLKWNYPWTKEVIDIASGLKKTPYETADPKKRMACFMSHYRLWELCVQQDESYMIFEHDAVFTRELNAGVLERSKYSVISLNDPRGATRRSQAFHESIKTDMKSNRWMHQVESAPWIDDVQVPQGLPGNSAYYIKPEGAKKLLNLVQEYGAWPNDAIMCKQLMPGKLGCLSHYATVVQKSHESTTTK